MVAFHQLVNAKGYIHKQQLTSYFNSVGDILVTVRVRNACERNCLWTYNVRREYEQDKDDYSFGGDGR